MTLMMPKGNADELAKKLRRIASRKSNLDRDKDLMIEAAVEIEKLADWCRKLIEAGKFPGEIGNPLQ